jgi:LruC domain-containing protein
MKIQLMNVFMCSLFFMTDGLAWDYFFGNDVESYDYRGIPKQLNANKKNISDELWQKITASIPEKKDIRSVNPAYITNDAGANIYLDEAGEVFVTFLHEGAGYKNSFGYYTFNNSSSVKREDINEVVIFPNASFKNSGGSRRGLNSGDTVNLGSFPAGTALGFFVVSNGWDGNHGVKSNIASKNIFYTLKGLNEESDESLRAHTVLLNDTETGNVILGIEDLLRTSSGCDHDFNDVVFMITSNPTTAINRTKMMLLAAPVDSDNDGVLDSNDAYPEDSEKAFNLFYPSKSQVGSIAFEDLWPKSGDYDMNDLVLEYNIQEIQNSQQQIMEVIVNLRIMARGADKRNGFAMLFKQLNPSMVETATIQINQQSAIEISPENIQNELIFELFNNAHQLTVTNDSCLFFNTQQQCSHHSSNAINLHIIFNQAINRAELGVPPYNPFIFNTHDDSLEIHLPNQPPSERANLSFFNQQDDTSELMTDRFYKTKENLPWALNIPFQWCYPAEEVNINQAYDQFMNWATSGGENNRDWYLAYTVTDKVYRCQH